MNSSRETDVGQLGPIPFCYISARVRLELAMHLDLPDHSHDWVCVAEELKFDPNHIRWIKDGRINKSGSSTLMFFDDCDNSGKTVQEFIQSLTAVGNLPACDIMKREFPAIVKSFERHQSDQMQFQTQQRHSVVVPRHFNSIPSSPSSSNPASQIAPAQFGTVSPPFSAKEREKVKAIIWQNYSQQEKQEHTVPQLKHTVSADPAIERGPFTLSARQSRVFVTYSYDNKHQLAMVVELCECLQKNQFCVSLDEREKYLVPEDKLAWLDKRFRIVNFILVLITPEYARDVQNTNRLVVDASDCRLSTQYIYKMMQNEYFHQGCINRRFIPVLMPSASLSHVPHWLQATVVYRWPDDYRSLFFYMTNPVNVVKNFCSDARGPGGVLADNLKRSSPG